MRGLEEEGNPKHRVRVEHNRDTLLIHISDEDARGWTTVAIDRPTREWAIAQRDRQLLAAEAAYALLYDFDGNAQGAAASDAQNVVHVRPSRARRDTDGSR